jgi:hypothetical protein
LIIITGPQATDDEVGDVEEMAALLGALPAYSAAIQWATVTALYCLAGWETCSLAVADVAVADALGLTVRHLPV